ncbi:polysaccharide deacetylase family protein [Peribacillus frigoritolerans]|nr:polysaccharide deacetylase family protein [Peribacillus frigoritolerans]
MVLLELFFVTGHYLKTAPELVVRMANEGHIVGNHSWNHPDMTSVTDDVIRTELERVQEATEKINGAKGNELFKAASWRI